MTTDNTTSLLRQIRNAIDDAEIADHFPRELIMSIDDHLAPCSAGCPGWAHFNLGADREGIQKCDDCVRFATDEEASEAHASHCRCLMGVDSEAEVCHYCDESLWDGSHVTDEHRVACDDCHQKRREAPLDAAGTRLPIGADWGVQTWAVGDLFVCDSEDGETYELVRRTPSCACCDPSEACDHEYETVSASTNVQLLIDLAIGNNQQLLGDQRKTKHVQ